MGNLRSRPTITNPIKRGNDAERRKMTQINITQDFSTDSRRIRSTVSHKKNSGGTKQNLKRWTSWHKKITLTPSRGPSFCVIINVDHPAQQLWTQQTDGYQTRLSRRSSTEQSTVPKVWRVPKTNSSTRSRSSTRKQQFVRFVDFGRLLQAGGSHLSGTGTNIIDSPVACDIFFVRCRVSFTVDNVPL